MRIDWTDYLRVHAERRNLRMHLIAAPLFVGSVVWLLLTLFRGEYMSAVIAVVLAFGAQTEHHARFSRASSSKMVAGVPSGHQNPD